MDDEAGAWAGAVGAWVPLFRLFSTVRDKLGIPEPDAADLLRNPLETLQIGTNIPDWRYSNGPENRLVSHRNGWTAVSSDGWKHVDWEQGTLKGHAVQVLWSQVQSKLRWASVKRARMKPKQGSAVVCTPAALGKAARKKASALERLVAALNKLQQDGIDVTNHSRTDLHTKALQKAGLDSERAPGKDKRTFERALQAWRSRRGE